MKRGDGMRVKPTWDQPRRREGLLRRRRMGWGSASETCRNRPNFKKTEKKKILAAFSVIQSGIKRRFERIIDTPVERFVSEAPAIQTLVYMNRLRFIQIWKHFPVIWEAMRQILNLKLEWIKTLSRSDSGCAESLAGVADKRRKCVITNCQQVCTFTHTHTQKKEFYRSKRDKARYSAETNPIKFKRPARRGCRHGSRFITLHTDKFEQERRTRWKDKRNKGRGLAGASELCGVTHRPGFISPWVIADTRKCQSNSETRAHAWRRKAHLQKNKKTKPKTKDQNPNIVFYPHKPGLTATLVGRTSSSQCNSNFFHRGNFFEFPFLI